MKKIVYRGIRDITVEDVPELNLGRGEVKIKIKYCGICGSDLHEYLHGPFPESPFGHEACGEIVALGEGVKDFVIGERVCSVIPGSFAEFINCPVERVLKIPVDMDLKRAAVVEPLSGAAGNRAAPPVLTPRGERASLGLLAIASHDTERYLPTMSTDFLVRIGELVTEALTARSA